MTMGRTAAKQGRDPIVLLHFHATVCKVPQQTNNTFIIILYSRNFCKNQLISYSNEISYFPCLLSFFPLICINQRKIFEYNYFLRLHPRGKTFTVHFSEWFAIINPTNKFRTSCQYDHPSQRYQKHLPMPLDDLPAVPAYAVPRSEEYLPIHSPQRSPGWHYHQTW